MLDKKDFKKLINYIKDMDETTSNCYYYLKSITEHKYKGNKRISIDFKIDTGFFKGCLKINGTKIPLSFFQFMQIKKVYYKKINNILKFRKLKEIEKEFAAVNILINDTLDSSNGNMKGCLSIHNDGGKLSIV